MLIRELRHLIHEEIGRNKHSREGVSFYPWNIPEDDYSIFWDPVDEDFTAQVEFEDGDYAEKSLADESEAKHWARQQVDRIMRQRFAKEK